MLFAINEPVDRRTIADPNRLGIVLARQAPAWEAGTRQAYHAVTLGFYEGALLRWLFGSPSAFGSPGAGGAMAFADPEVGVGYAYVTSQMGTALTGDPRDVALRAAVYSALGASTGATPAAA